MESKTINKKIINATKWSAITEIISKLITPITQMILARIISPEAFGVVATVTMIISFADMFTDAGFQKYLVQHEFNSEEDKFKNANVAFWTNICISILIWSCIIIFREQLAIAVGNPGLGNVIAIACFQLLLTSFSSIQMALYRRSFDFKTLFMVKIVSVFVPFIITIPLALVGLSYWSLIIGSIVMQVLNALILTIKSKWKPYFFYNIKILKEMISFSIWSLIEAISIWLSSWMDILVIGTVFSEFELGVYKTSTSMVTLLMSLIVSAVVPVFFSALSRLQNDEQKFNDMFFKVQKIMSILVFPLGIGVYLYSDLAMKILLGGGNWIEAGDIIGISALTLSIKLIFGDLCSEVYRAKGMPKVSFFAQILHLIVLIPICIISSRFGFWQFVFCRSWIRVQFIIVHFIIMKFIIKFPVEKFFRNVAPTAISTILMGLLAYCMKQVSNNTLWSITSIIICSLFYFCILYQFKSIRKEMDKVIKIIKPKLTKHKYTEVN